MVELYFRGTSVTLYVQFTMIPVVLSLLTVFLGVMGDTICYVGESVTLTSRDKPSGNITQIEWFIFTNRTWIATYQEGEIDVEWFWQFKSRLHLNTLSGDLEIRNVKKNDEMEYSVLLKDSKENQYTSKVRLTVTEPPPLPKIQKEFSMLKDEHCVMALRCYSSIENANLSWATEATFDVPFWSRSDNTSTSVLWTSYSPNRNVTFTCSINNKFSVNVTQSCQEEELMPVVVKGERRFPFTGFFMVLLGVCFTLLLVRLKLVSSNCLQTLPCRFWAKPLSSGEV
ncbi:hypothetical protein UPYG_G00237220 [Umbra pygmaea]|uniref:Ig-like domain-containing protein n=1 Tax=Umbra pygmaea TaxID=75934 RepID=A0ABD0X0R7_UMBPY